MAHQRLEHPKNGPVHVFFPENYDPMEGITVFVHGFGDGKPWYVDVAVEEFALAKKLASTMSRSALVAIESKKGSGQPIHWTKLDDLVSFLRASNVDIPPALSIHAIGHSGAYANIAMWLGNQHLSHVTLLDATYGQFSAYEKWALEEGATLDIAVNKNTNTHKGAHSILANLPSYHVWQTTPDHELGEIDLCKVGYMPMKRAHMKWVTDDEPMQFFLTRGQMIRDLEKHE